MRPKFNINDTIETLRSLGLLDNPAPETILLKREQHPHIIPVGRLNNNHNNSWVSNEGSEYLIGQNIYTPTCLQDIPDTSAVAGRVQKEGIEALAWYDSFHWNNGYSYRNSWGIKITISGIFYLAKDIFGPAKLQTKDGILLDCLDLIQLSYRFLYFHEYFHFITDVASSILELAEKRKYYPDYFHNIYSAAPLYDFDPLEEALANAFAYKKLYDANIRKCIKPFMENQRSGYKKFYDYIGKDAFDIGKRELAMQIIQRDPALDYFGYFPMEAIFDTSLSHLSYNDVPVYLVDSNSGSEYELGFVDRIANFKMTDKYNKDFSSLPENIQKKVEKLLVLLKQNTRHPGVNFEKLRGSGNVFTARVNDNYRISMRPSWDLLRVGTHSEIYKFPV